MKLAIGSVLAALAVFMWGFVYWGAGLIDPFSHMSPEAEAQIAQSLQTSLTADGVYFLPESAGKSEQDWMDRMTNGPVATINFKAGGAAPMPVTMGLGYVHMLVSALLLGLLMQMLLPLAPTYLDRLKWACAIGVLATVQAHLGTPIWWHYPWIHALLGTVYDLGTYVIGGAVLAYFITPAKA